MGKRVVEEEKLFCERCDHDWKPKGDGNPKVCPECKSPYWDTPRREHKNEN